MTLKRVALLFEFPTLSGGERSLLAALDGIDRDRWACLALAPPEGRLARALHAAGVEIETLGRLADPLEVAAEAGADLVHANSLSMAVRAGSVATRADSLPFTAHIRDIQRLGGDRRTALDRSSGLVAVSRAVQASLTKQGLDSTVVHNGIAPGPPRQPADIPLVLGVGQISRRKGQDVFLAAAARLVERIPEVQFHVLGERWSRKPEAVEIDQALRRAATAGPLSGRLTLAGWVEDVRERMAGAALLLHTARQEPLGRVLLEAGACGLPVVASDVGGTREIVKDGVTGLLIPPDDPAAAAAACAALLEDADAARAMGEAARERMAQRFPVADAGRGLESAWTAALHPDAMTDGSG